MIGHEGVRRLTEHVIASHLPVRLDAIRAAVPPLPVANAPAVWPPDPTIFCADVIPDRSDWFPAVMVGSAKLTSMSATEGGTAGVAFHCVYELDVAVAVVAAQAGGSVLASVGRDRLLLAVRETVLLHSKVTEDVWLTVRGLTEETGPVSEDMAARPMSGGVVSLEVHAIESVDEHGWKVKDLVMGLEVRSAEQPFSTELDPPQPLRTDETITRVKTKG